MFVYLVYSLPYQVLLCIVIGSVRLRLLWKKIHIHIFHERHCISLCLDYYEMDHLSIAFFMKITTTSSVSNNQGLCFVQRRGFGVKIFVNFENKFVSVFVQYVDCLILHIHRQVNIWHLRIVKSDNMAARPLIN